MQKDRRVIARLTSLLVMHVDGRWVMAAVLLTDLRSEELGDERHLAPAQQVRQVRL